MWAARQHACRRSCSRPSRRHHCQRRCCQRSLQLCSRHRPNLRRRRRNRPSLGSHLHSRSDRSHPCRVPQFRHRLRTPRPCFDITGGMSQLGSDDGIVTPASWPPRHRVKVAERLTRLVGFKYRRIVNAPSSNATPSALKNAVIKCVPCRYARAPGCWDAGAFSVGTWGGRRDHSAHRTAGPTDASETCTLEPVCRRPHSDSHAAPSTPHSPQTRLLVRPSALISTSLTLVSASAVCAHACVYLNCSTCCSQWPSR